MYLRAGRYRVHKRDGSAQTFQTLDAALQLWAVEYGDAVGDTFHEVQLDYQRRTLPDKALSTQKEYLKALDRLDPVFGHMRMLNIKPAHIYAYQEARAKQGAKVLVNRELAVLSNVCNHAIKLGHIDRNPCKEVRRMPEKPRTRYVADDELALVYDLASDWMKKAIRLICITGMRLGDIMRLSDGNHWPEGLYYVQGKTGRKLLIEWTDELRECAVKPPVSYDGFQTAWQRLMKVATDKERDVYLQERFTFHDLRAKAGSDADDIGILGHTDKKLAERVYRRKPAKFQAGRFMGSQNFDTWQNNDQNLTTTEPCKLLI